MNPKRVLTVVLVGTGIVVASAVGAGASFSGEAPEPEGFPEEIVIGESRFVAEEERGYDFIIPQALTVDEPPPATNTLAELEVALGIANLRLITSGTEMMTPDHRREESMYLTPDGGVLTVWWQQVDPTWDVMGRDIFLEGWPDGVEATISVQSGHIQVVFSDGRIHGSVVIEKNFNDAYARPSLSAQETIDLALAAYASLTEGK